VVSEDDLRLMRRIDELYLMTPFYGARRMVAVLRPGWLDGEPQAGAAADARDADRSDLPEAEHQPPPPGSRCLIHTFYAVWRLTDRTRCGAAISRIVPLAKGSCI